MIKSIEALLSKTLAGFIFGFLIGVGVAIWSKPQTNPGVAAVIFVFIALGIVVQLTLWPVLRGLFRGRQSSDSSGPKVADQKPPSSNEMG
jgi:hypothetical protein